MSASRICIPQLKSVQSMTRPFVAFCAALGIDNTNTIACDMTSSTQDRWLRCSREPPHPFPSGAPEGWPPCSHGSGLALRGQSNCEISSGQLPAIWTFPNLPNVVILIAIWCGCKSIQGMFARCTACSAFSHKSGLCYMVSHAPPVIPAVFHSCASYNQDKIGRTTDEVRPRHASLSRATWSRRPSVDERGLAVDASQMEVYSLATESRTSRSSTRGTRVHLLKFCSNTISNISTVKDTSSSAPDRGGLASSSRLGLGRTLLTHQHIPPATSDTLTRRPRSAATKYAIA